MLPLRGEVPVEGRGYALCSETVRDLLARKQSAAVDPRAKICGDGHVRRCRGDATREVAVEFADGVHDEAKTLLRRHRALCGELELSGHGDGWRAVAAPALRYEGNRFEKGFDLPSPGSQSF